MNFVEWIKQPWPWYVAGPLIGLIVPFLLVIGNKSFGISSSLRHICAACLPANIPFFKYDWKKEIWNLFFVAGIIIGAFLVVQFFTNPDEIDLNPRLIADLEQKGISNFQGVVPNELFNWFPTLTIIENGPAGIYPHDMARDAIATELHWRNPEWYRHLHIKMQQFFSSRILKQTGEKQRQLIFGLIFLHRMNPAIKHFFEFQETGSTWQDKMNDEDRQPILGMIKKYEGNAAARIFEQWMDDEAATIWVFRDAEKNTCHVCIEN